MSLIETKNLTKRFHQALRDPGLVGAFKHLVTRNYREIAAVDGINLTVERGEALGYVGPNGAGKSTTVKMLTGILVPTSGSVVVDGLIPHEERIANARKIGVVFGQRTQLWWDLPVIESFHLLKDVYKIPDAVYRENIDRFTAILGLDEFLHQSARQLSLGQRMRADLAASLLHNPKIVYLDEPTIGLDVAVKQRIRRFIKKINKQRETTVILTTHDLDDIEDICDRLVIIDQGRIIYDGDLDTVKDTFATERVIHFQLRQPSTEINGIFDGLTGVHVEHLNDLRFSLRFDRFEATAGEIAHRVMAVADVADFQIDEPEIEEVVRRVYDGEIKLA